MMANQVSGAALGPILDRLKNTPRNRPMDAGTFADWSTEAGDTVTMQREGTSFQSQVHSSSMTWRGGSPTVEMNSTGNEKRDPITKISKQKYSRGGVGRRISENTYQWEVNQNHLLYEVDDKNGKFARLEVDVNGIRGRVEDGEGRIGKLELRANRFSARIEKVVDESGNVKYAEIAAGINDSDETYAYITAEHIRIGGSSKLSSLITIREQGGIFLRAMPVYFGTGFSNMVNINQGKVNSRAYGIYAENGQSNYTLDYASLNTMIKTAETVGTGNNTLRLTFWNGEHLDFSKATSLSGEWSGRNYTVTAKQNGVTVGTKTGIVYNGIVPVEGTITKSGKTVYKDFKVFSDDGNGDADKLIMTKNLSINASSVYDDGWAGCYSDIGLNYSTTQTLDPGESVTIYPACKPTPTGSHASITTKGVKVKANAVTYESPYGTALANSYTTKTSGNITANGKSSTFSLSITHATPPGTATQLTFVTLTLGSRNIGRIQI